MTAIQLPAGAGGARILGLGSYRPRRRVTNDELAQVMDTNDEWIQTRVGIAERRWASEDETLVEMAVAAGGKAIAASGLAPDEIDLVIVASASLRVPIPGIAPQVAYRLGVARPGSFDLNAGCAGFCYALSVANDNIRSGSSVNALVVGVERLTDVTDQTDRTTAVIFADGAGAAVISASDEAGISLSKRRITLSTSGVVPMMARAGQRVSCPNSGELPPGGVDPGARRSCRW